MDIHLTETEAAQFRKVMETKPQDLDTPPALAAYLCVCEDLFSTAKLDSIKQLVVRRVFAAKTEAAVRNLSVETRIYEAYLEDMFASIFNQDITPKVMKTQFRLIQKYRHHRDGLALIQDIKKDHADLNIDGDELSRLHYIYNGYWFNRSAKR